MKKAISYLLLLMVALPTFAQGERELNEQYREAIKDFLSQEVAGCQKIMQKRAAQMLASLPNDEKLYDENYLNVSCSIIEGDSEEGDKTLDLMYVITYNCHNEEGFTDDYRSGSFDVDSSNSCRAICSLTKTFVEGVLSDYFRAGKQVSMTLYASADGSLINATLPYDGRYGEYRYVPSVFNDEQLRLSVDSQTGINNNAQLAYLRAQAVRYWLENNVRNLQRTTNDYSIITRSYADTGAYYRRSSIVLKVHDAFSETIERMTADKIQDDYVDFNIPQRTTSFDNAYVLIIANEDYDHSFLPSVPFALNDGKTMADYFVTAIGVPERQVKVINNASREQIMDEGVKWLTDLSQAVATTQNDAVVPHADLFVYFAGHGFTGLDNVTYIIPNKLDVDGIKSLKSGEQKRINIRRPDEDPGFDIVLKSKEAERFAQQCISVEQLCGVFKNYPVRNLTVIVDASMDGCQRSGMPMLRADRKVEKKSNAAKGKKRKANMRADAVVLMAAAPDKTAFSFDDQHHGFLTYFLLKEIKGLAGDLDGYTYRDIYENVGRKLGKESALQGRWQEIYGLAGGKYKDAWSILKLK